MSEYGVTHQGFVIKRLDTILEELHTELSEGFGVDTRLNPESFLNVMITTYGNQIAELWEIAQNSYYAKYPATAEGINLDNAVQYGGIRRKKSRGTYYFVHCTGDDGTVILESTIIATCTMPQIQLYAVSEFIITRENFNKVEIRVAVVEVNNIYSVSINGKQYSYLYEYEGLEESPELTIVMGLREMIANPEYIVSIDTEQNKLIIVDTVESRNNQLILSDNLTTTSVTTIGTFVTEQYGKYMLPNGTITDIITSVGGLHSVVNLLEPIYGRIQETDVELRHSYLEKSAIRSTRMIDSICSHLLNNIDNVENAIGYENPSNVIDEAGRPPHSIEIVVDGGNEQKIAEIILDKKAAGIQTYGNIEVPVAGEYGDTIPIQFSRPDYLYAWFKVILHGDKNKMPVNYSELTIKSIVEYGKTLDSGVPLLSQLLLEYIYDTVGGITYIEIKLAATSDESEIPNMGDYNLINISTNQRQKVLIADTRIEVDVDGDI